MESSSELLLAHLWESREIVSQVSYLGEALSETPLNPAVRLTQLDPQDVARIYSRVRILRRVQRMPSRALMSRVEVRICIFWIFADWSVVIGVSPGNSCLYRHGDDTHAWEIPPAPSLEWASQFRGGLGYLYVCRYFVMTCWRTRANRQKAETLAEIFWSARETIFLLLETDSPVIREISS